MLSILAADSLLTQGLVIGIVTLVAYSSAYAYEVGQAYGFGLPVELAKVNDTSYGIVAILALVLGAALTATRYLVGAAMLNQLAGVPVPVLGLAALVVVEVVGFGAGYLAAVLLQKFWVLTDNPDTVILGLSRDRMVAITVREGTSERTGDVIVMGIPDDKPIALKLRTVGRIRQPPRQAGHAEEPNMKATS